MDRKTEDLIARLAFGELTEAEAAQVKAMAGRDADTARALEGYELLRSDLRRMRDVPPDQLSKERLQNAILAQGLKPRPVRQGFPWIWAPAATVAAALALFVFMRPSNHGIPSGGDRPISGGIMAINDLNEAPGNPLNTDDVTMVGRSISRSMVEAAESNAPEVPEQHQAEQPVVANSIGKPALVRRAAKASRGRASNSERLAFKRLQDKSAGPFETLALIPRSAPEAIESSSQPRESIVLIQTERDANTGAKSALEVQQTENVIVSS